MMARVLAIFLAVLILAGCSGTGGMFGAAPTKRPVDVAALPAMRIARVDLVVPSTLKVSEENSIKPAADIVWRGDPYGDRFAQVAAVMREGIRRGTRGMNGAVPIVLHVTLHRFHAQTERVRYSYGGEHEIVFTLSADNAVTGAQIIPPYLVNATFAAYGGDQAIAADRAGNGQKVRILNQLEQVIRQELTGIAAQPVP